MKRKKNTIYYFILNLFLMFFVYTAFAEYSADPINITNDPVSSIRSIKIAACSNGDTYVAWQSSNSPEDDKLTLKLQLLDSKGNAKWEPAGLTITTTDTSSISFEDDLHLLVSGEGDAILSITASEKNKETKNRSVTVYKINSQKEFLWSASGKSIFYSEVENASRPNSIALDGSGNLLVTATTDINTYVYIISPEASDLLESPIKLEKINSQPIVLPSTDDNIFVIYKVSNSLYANLYNSSGTILKQGVYLGDKTGENLKPADKYFAYSDGLGGVIVCWEYLYDERNNKKKSIIVQKLDNNCERIFGDDGLSVTSLDGINSAPLLVVDTTKNIIYVAFASSILNKKNLVLQSINYEGEKLHGDNGFIFTDKFDEAIDNKPIAMSITPNDKSIIIWRYKNTTTHTEELRATRIGNIAQGIEWEQIFNKDSNIKTNFVYTGFLNNQVVVAWCGEDSYINSLQNKYIKAQNISYNGLLGIDNSHITQEIENLLKVNIFPNPVINSENININLFLPSPQIVTMNLYDNSGKILNSRESIYCASSSNLFSFSTEDLSTGTYFINISTNYKNIICKFIKK